MWKSAFAAATLALTLAVPSIGSAATVAQGATRVDDGFNIVPLIGSSVASDNTVYDNSATTPSSDWVWVGDILSMNSAVYVLDFDMTGFDVSTSAISGLWGADNNVAISLNGNSVFTSPVVGPSNYNSLNVFSITDVSLFNAGSNTLRFDLADYNLTNTTNPAAFRAVVEVEADELASAVIPLPAAGTLLLLGLGGLVGVRRYRKG